VGLHVNANDFREVMRRFPTGVTVVAVADGAGEPWGLTVSSFTSVSLDPPLVLVCIDRTSNTHDRIVEAPGFGISVLAAGQAAVATRFAVDPPEGRFDQIDWEAGPVGYPVIEGAAAWLQCDLHDVLPGGDHSIILGRVSATGVSREPPMVYHEGAFGSVAP
jgi:flavin reductase (DIM6/NTAB) family NADH-FMN oxidoreductase RutF